ncbi:hypothetical protein BC829DRAFT_59376 [Chytridium lagenaria]|nr:hypothetical protein BC829DRAFT_59376 [Chytridium lagenaria]
MSASNSAATSPTRKPSNAKPLSPKESLFSTEPPTSQQEPCLRTPTRRYSAAKTIAEHSLKVETADRRNSGVQESPLLLPSQITSASTSASRKEDAKKNRSHRLSETTSGHFAVWMNQNEATSPGDGSARSPKSNRRWSRDAGSLMSGAGSMSPTREQPEIFVGSRGRSILDTQKRTAQISPTRGTFSVLSDGSRDAFGSESSLATDTSLRRSPSPSSLGAPPAPVRLQRATSSPVTLRPQLGLHNKSSPESHQRAESESVKPDTPNRDLAPLFKHSATSGGFGKSGGIGVGWSIRVGTMKAPSVVKPTDAKNDGQNGKTTGANSKPAEGGLGFFGKRSTRK